LDVYGLLVFAHLLAFTFWLGADLGVAVLGQAFRDTSKPLATRLEILRLLGVVDMGPRSAWVLMVPLSLSLVDAGGHWDVPLVVLGVSWLIAGLWMWLLWAGHLAGQTSRAAGLRRAEFWLKIVIMMGFWALGLAAVLGGGPLPANWLGWKALVFAAIFAVAIMIDVAARPVGPLLARLIAEGSSPATEQPLRVAMDRARLWVWATYGLLVVIAWLGSAKPF
jgi:hypothetical protein